MNQILIIPAGTEVEKIEKAIKSFNAVQAYLITAKKYASEAEKITSILEKSNIQVKSIPLKPSFWEEYFRITREIVSLHAENGKETEFIMLTDISDPELQTISSTAAFVNGIKAAMVDKGELKLLPLFKFNYYSALTDKKMQILKILEEDKTCCKSFEELSKRTGMSLPLISYHINGNLKSEGLKTLGLIITSEKNGRINVSLSPQGRMLLAKYIDEEPSKK